MNRYFTTAISAAILFVLSACAGTPDNGREPFSELYNTPTGSTLLPGDYYVLEMLIEKKLSPEHLEKIEPALSFYKSLSTWRSGVNDKLLYLADKKMSESGNDIDKFAILLDQLDFKCLVSSGFVRNGRMAICKGLSRHTEQNKDEAGPLSSKSDIMLYFLGFEWTVIAYSDGISKPKIRVVYRPFAYNEVREIILQDNLLD